MDTDKFGWEEFPPHYSCRPDRRDACRVLFTGVDDAYSLLEARMAWRGEVLASVQRTRRLLCRYAARGWIEFFDPPAGPDSQPVPIDLGLARLDDPDSWIPREPYDTRSLWWSA